MKPLLIVKTGTTVPAVAERRGDFEDWFAEGTGIPREELRVVSVFEGAALPDPGAVRGVIVTGSAAMVTDHEPWSDATADWLGRMARQTDVPATSCSRRASAGASSSEPLLRTPLGHIASEIGTRSSS